MNYSESPESNNLYPHLTKERLVFVHIPKNYGTSVMKIVFGVHGAKCHNTMEQIRARKQHEDYKGFCFVRDPVKRFVSVYLWRKRKDKTLDGQLWIPKIGMKGVLERLLDEEINQPTEFNFEAVPTKLNRMFLRQSTWVDENMVFVGRCENFTSDLLKVGKKYDIKFLGSSRESLESRHLIGKEFKTNSQSSGRKRQTEQKFREILRDSSHLRNRFLDYYAQDYENFGYKINI